MSAPAVPAADVEGIEKVAEAKVAVAKAEEKVTKAEEKVAKAEEKVAKAEEKVAKAEEKIAKAKEEVVKAKEEVAKADIELKATANSLLKVALEGLQTAQDGVKSAQDGVKSAQDGVKSAQNVLDDANDGLIAANKMARQASQRLLDTTSESGALSITRQEDFFQRLLLQQRKELLQIVCHLSQPENPWAGLSSRSSADSDTSASSDFGPRLLFFYNRNDNAAFAPSCVVSGAVDNVSNGIFLLQSIERQFDQLRVCFVCDPFQISAQFVVVHGGIIDELVPGTSVRFRELHNKRVEFDKDQRPSFQLLSIHAVHAFKHLHNTSWMSEEEKRSFESVVRVGSPPKLK